MPLTKQAGWNNYVEQSLLPVTKSYWSGVWM